ncbi:amidohydrolase family protein [Phycisphaera mikurensis]|uniref:Putative hydrolase n=1 Tax=Phycisphaera mikurensis (strain NBRC 102666 / KCTC 22515 / FYK2301M01) TaxID=1142394 RepID=I0IJ30_PHYMF|nr:amidohydrolase family protein [Phycisphaera mikurensis]MBB6443115.1 hypothetical protein [Phycisphaera mikurensis]BAM05268.1 putative hydrolase [Phycisphaera mikurensis NBRC 102666]
MIVDLHTRIWNSVDSLGDAIAAQARRTREDASRAITASFDVHEVAMAPVSVAVVHGLDSHLLDARLDAGAVAAEVARSKDTLLGFVGLDPLGDDPTGRLHAAVDDHGCVGVNLCPAAGGFHPSATPTMELLEAVAERGLPVYVEAGAQLAREAKLEFAQPFLLDEVLRTFPEMKLVISGFGEPWPNQTVALLRKHPQAFTDVSGLVSRPWQLYNALVSAWQAGVMDQVLFGSGFPAADPERAIVTLYSVNSLTQGTPLPSIPREQLRGVVERDTLKILGLPDPTPEDAGDAKSSSAFARVVVESGPGEAGAERK